MAIKAVLYFPILAVTTMASKGPGQVEVAVLDNSFGSSGSSLIVVCWVRHKVLGWPERLVGMYHEFELLSISQIRAG